MIRYRVRRKSDGLYMWGWSIFNHEGKLFSSAKSACANVTGRYFPKWGHRAFATTDALDLEIVSCKVVDTGQAIDFIDMASKSAKRKFAEKADPIDLARIALKKRA